MSTLDDLNHAVTQQGARWIKLRATTDPAVDGEILAFEQREMSWQGAPVLNSKTGAPRIEWIFTLLTTLRDDDEDDGTRKLPANESMQRAIGAAIKAAGAKAEIGGRLQVAVSEDPANATDQAGYRAKYTPPAAPTVSADDLF